MQQEQIIRSFYDAVSRHDLEKALSFFSDDAQFKDISSDTTFRGKPQIRQMMEGWTKAFSDMKLQPSSVISNSSGEMFSAELMLSGTHTGPLSMPEGDLPATGKKVSVPSCDVIRIKEGKIQSVSCYFAAPVLLKQIGMMPSRKAA